MIQFQQVKKEFGDNNFVLGEISFQINEGEFLFLIGPSGSGKTSLIRLLIREESPTAGKIYFDDYDITRLTRDSIYKLRRYIGVIFQDYKLIADKTVYENVAFAMEVAGKTNKQIKETVPYLLDLVGLEDRADAFPDYLSGGEKQRVAIARAVSNNPRVLIADEPTGNLDPGAAWDIVQILSKINNWGTTVIMSTHGTDIVNTLSKRVIQMEGGQIIRDDNRGVYEVTGREIEEGEKPPMAEQPQLEEEAPRSGPIRVRIRTGVSNQEEQKQRKGLFSWLPFGKKEDLKEPTPLEEEYGQVIDEEIAEQEVIEAESPLLQISDAEVRRILDEADNTGVEQLGLAKEIIADLKTAGYEDIEDIISVGPEQLANELIIDPEEVVLIARSLSEYLTAQAEGNKGKITRALNQKSKKVTKPKEQKQKEETQDEEANEDAKVEKEKVEDEVEVKKAKKKAAVKSKPKPKSKKKEIKVDLTAKKQTDK